MFENVTIYMIANMDKERGIGYKGKLLYHLKEDLKLFKQLTLNKTIVYGRKTLNTFPNARPLKDRNNILLSSKDIPIENTVVLHSIKDVDQYCKKNSISEIYIVGGQSVYEQFLPFTSIIYMSIVHHKQKADVFFPIFEDAFERKKECTIEDVYSFDWVIYQIKGE